MKEIIGVVKSIERDKNYPRLNVVVETLIKEKFYIQVMEKDMHKASEVTVGRLARFEVRPVLKEVERRDQKLYYNNLILEEAMVV